MFWIKTTCKHKGVNSLASKEGRRIQQFKRGDIHNKNDDYNWRVLYSNSSLDVNPKSSLLR